MKFQHLLCAALAGWLAPVHAADVPVSGRITTNTTWSSDNVYRLSGYVFVTSGATLTIQPGTVVKAEVSSGGGAAALVITRGAKIMAEGTADRPIIFTSALDSLDGNLGPNDSGLWGGLVILGRASINSRADSTVVAAPVEDEIEGFSVTGDDLSLIRFGGTDDADNSGVVRYVSIRHGGAVIGTANEINGLTLGGVGTGTTIEYVEVFANQDDGFEWFGGTVNARHLVSAFNHDDAFDMDQGYRGNLQFLFGLQRDTGVADTSGDKGFEWDGATSPLTASPKGRTVVSNATIIGSRVPEADSRTTIAVNIRDAVEALLHNSVFVNFKKGVDFENDVDDGPNPVPVLKANTFFSHIAANNTAINQNGRPAGAVDAGAILGDATITFVDPQLRGISYAADAMLDPRPASGSPLLAGFVPVADAGIAEVSYRGAFGDSNWATGWTKLWEDGYFADDATGGDDTPEILEGSTGKPVNLSTRGLVGTGDQVMIGGFVIGGEQRQTVLIRAAGPTIGAAPYNVPGTLADPVLEVFQGQTSLATNDDHSAQIAPVAARVGAFPLTDGSGDAALVLNLDPGVYSAVVRGKNNTTGVVLLEVYEVD